MKRTPNHLQPPARRAGPGAPARAAGWPGLATLGLLAGVLAGTAWPLASHAEDLLDSYRLARRGDPVLAAADATRGAVREGVAQAQAPLWPQLSASAGFNNTRDPGAGGAVSAGNGGSAANRSRNVQASLTQVLVDTAQRATWRAAGALASAQDARLRAADQALCLRVATAYIGVLTSSDTLATTLANEDAFGQQVDQAEQRYRTGLSALVDLEQARAFHATARANTIAARTALADAREALAEITGAAPGALKTLRDDLPAAPPQPADAQAWVDAALRDNPALQAQQRSVDAAEQAVAAARAGHLPTLSAAVDVGRQAGWPQPLSGSDGRTVTTLGVTLKVPLFAGGATQSQAAQAAFLRDFARNDFERQRRQIGRDTLAQYRSVLAGIDQMAATRAAVQASAKALASTRVGRQLDTQTMNDLLFAIQNYGAAQNAYSAARHQFVLNQLRLQQAAGALGEGDLAALNALLQ